ncbi:hypothetical protein JXC34_07520 [Candidatus Woesearchaeota archaeon]|nr:hypothetical protein [Candidatus Woesearchaeota archaeon]
MEEQIIVVGQCAIDGVSHPMNVREAEIRTDAIGKFIANVNKIIVPYGTKSRERGGSYKPRTSYKNGNGEKVFDGLERQGLEIHRRVAEKYGLIPVSEIMDYSDVDYFLDVPDMNLQIGARNAQNFGLLYKLGARLRGEEEGHPEVLSNDVIAKSNTQGHNKKEAIGALDRLSGIEGNLFYCLRGQCKPNSVSGIDRIINKWSMAAKYLFDEHQHPDYRNLNQFGIIYETAKDLENIAKIMFDPSHMIGGKTDQTRRDIGLYAIEAGKLGYHLMLEINIDANCTQCDADQALPPTLNGIDWGRTQYGEEPKIKPYSFVDIISEIIRHKVETGVVEVSQERLKKDLYKLQQLQYPTPDYTAR